MPSARFLTAGNVSLNWSHVDPYLRGSVVAYPFNWMEAAYTYTDINNALYSNVPAFSGGQSYKDKGFDIKIRVLKENSFFPNIAFGLRDLGGGNTFQAEYLVFSKYIKNIDFTVGLGWGHLSYGEFTNPLKLFFDSEQLQRDSRSRGQGGNINFNRFFRGETGIFGGLEYFIPNAKGARIKLEYDSTKYTEEGFPFGRSSSQFAFESVKQPSSRFNIGLVYPYSNNLNFKAAFIKGNTFNFGFSLNFDLSSSDSIVRKEDSFVEVRDTEILKDLSSKENINYYRLLLNRMNERELNLQHANLTEDTASVVFTQSKYLSHSRALGRVIRVMDAVTPDAVNEFEVININSNLGMYKATINRRTFTQNIETNYYPLVLKDTKIQDFAYHEIQTEYNPSAPYPSHHYYITPYLRSQIGGPEGFFFGDLRIGFESEFQISRGLSIFTQAGIGLYSTFNELNNPSDSILPRVRTDIIQYLKETEDFQIDRMNIAKFFNPKRSYFLKLQAGILEPMFSGLGGEFLYRPFDKDYAAGFELWHVKQRAYDMRFDHLDYETITGHINLYYQEPKSKVLLTVRGGKFLAKDSGLHFNFSRRFKSGFTVGAFFSKTDISDFEFGEGSFDKGFYFYIPMEIFNSKFSKRTIPWGLRPVTRDGAAFLGHSFELYGVTEQANYEALVRDFDHIYD